MRPVLVDSNVLLDIAYGDPVWGSWSEATLHALANETVLVINALIFAEVSVFFERVEDVDAAFPPALYERRELPYEAAFLAGKCFLRYRRRGGPRRSPLPDFFIGAHAAVAEYRLLTRDPRRYREYFPRLDLICPDT